MGFERDKMTFEQADEAFEALSGRHRRGEISDEEFDSERQRLMVLDDQGRWWAKSKETGAWNYHDGRAWISGTPPGYEPETTTETPTASATTSAAETGRRSGSSSRWIVAAVGVVVLLLIGGGLFYFVTSGPGEPVASGGTADETTSNSANSDNSGDGEKVPDLVGSASLEEARERAGDDFEVVEDGKKESKEPIGSVVSQEDESDSRIAVKLSKGVEVLDVVGNDREPAVELLEGRLFDVNVKTAPSPDYREGKIISQKPKGGSFAESEAEVTLTVGAGENGGSEQGSGSSGSSAAGSQYQSPDSGGGGWNSGGGGDTDHHEDRNSDDRENEG